MPGYSSTICREEALRLFDPKASPFYRSFCSGETSLDRSHSSHLRRACIVGCISEKNGVCLVTGKLSGEGGGFNVQLQATHHPRPELRPRFTSTCQAGTPGLAGSDGSDAVFSSPNGIFAGAWASDGMKASNYAVYPSSPSARWDRSDGVEAVADNFRWRRFHPRTCPALG